MGKEIIDMSTDEESDCMVICSASVNPERQNALAFKPSQSSEFDEAVDGIPDSQISHSCSESRDYEVKYCSLDGTDEKPTDHINLESTMKPASKSANIGIARTKYTVPQPFALETEKRASGGNHPFVANAANSGNRHAQSKNMEKKPHNNSPFISRKPLQPDNKKHTDEEDACSVTSLSAGSVGASKSKSTIGSVPNFRCKERAEKRREFYSKLEEKHQALEAEKTQYEARTKEEREVAIKQLRKSLTFKATPMPNFYHDGPPPKLELKKLPTTRAKSPKLGRRKSYADVTDSIDATNSFLGDKNTGTHGRVNRHSLGTLNATTNKSHDGVRNDTASCNAKERKLVKEASKFHPREVTEQTKSDITVQS